MKTSEKGLLPAYGWIRVLSMTRGLETQITKDDLGSVLTEILLSPLVEGSWTVSQYA